MTRTMLRQLGSALFAWGSLSGLLLSCEATHEVENVGSSAFAEPSVAGEPKFETSPASPEVQRDPLKSAYFGDLHVHTSWSLDAFAMQVQVEPEDAYRYAQGGAIKHASGERIDLREPHTHDSPDPLAHSAPRSRMSARTKPNWSSS